MTDDGYAAKLLGKMSDGQLIYGYALLPWINKTAPIMSPRLPVFTQSGNRFEIKLHIDNYGQVTSTGNTVLLTYSKDGREVELGKTQIAPGIKPFSGTDVMFKTTEDFKKDKVYNVTVKIDHSTATPITLHGKVVPVK